MKSESEARLFFEADLSEASEPRQISCLYRKRAEATEEGRKATEARASRAEARGEARATKREPEGVPCLYRIAGKQSFPVFTGTKKVARAKFLR